MPTDLSIRTGVCCVTVAVLVLTGGCRRGESSGKGTYGTSQGAGWLTEITEEVGLDFAFDAGPFGRLHLPEIMASGVAWLDFDGDGDLDIYFSNGHHNLPEPDSKTGITNRYFRNDGGRYVEATRESGLGDPGYGMGVAAGDIDNDGDRDVYVTNLGPDRLYRNRGDGTFEDITAAAGIDVDGWSCSASFLDYDRDGYLDLFVTQYVKWIPSKQCTDRAGRLDYCSPLSFHPDYDVLLHNEGDGTFTDVTEAAGIRSSQVASALGVTCADMDGDGWIDIYVTNDAYANHLWINQQDGTFRDDAVVLGCAYNLHGQSEAGMGIVAADFDNDLDLDLFMTHLTRETNTFYRNSGRLGFLDATGESGLAAASTVHTGFGIAPLDLELDGDLDILVVNGRVTREEPTFESAEVAPPWEDYAEPNLVFTNDGTGRFVKVHDQVASFCDRVEITRGLTNGDVDGDGDLDILITNTQSSARMYRNDAPRAGHWLIVRALHPEWHRDAVGATVTVYCKGRPFLRTVSSAYSYLSASEPSAHFGLGSADRIEHIEVRWPDGTAERFPGMAPDRRVELVYGTGRNVD